MTNARTFRVMFVWSLTVASYEIEISADPITATSWRHLDTIKPSIHKAKNLTSGSRYWFRVRAIGSRDVKGAWSDPAVKMAT